jgi:hypothetical protein
MKYSRAIIMLLLVSLSLAFLGCSSGPTEKDVVGKWQSTKLENLWMEFYPDKTSTGGNWSITKEGRIKLVNPDGKEHLAELKDGKLIFPEFGERGIFVKETQKK